jgi:deoxyribose-phosphate aldolase
MTPVADTGALAAALEHTRLAATTTSAEIEVLCAEARLHGFAAVCVHGVHVARCRELLRASAVRVVTVIGFPLGADAPRAKRAAAAVALDDGAQELDMVLQIGALRGGDEALAARDVEGVVEVARPAGALVKLILETGLLTRAEVRRACALAEASGADFVKTSTGFGPRGASREDVEWLRECVGTRLGIKAAGGIRTASFARALLAAGATRLGSSASVAIVRGAQDDAAEEPPPEG